MIKLKSLISEAYSYRFPYKLPLNKKGADYPVDVYYGNTYLGRIIHKKDHYVIRMVVTPKKQLKIKNHKANYFKSNKDAIDALHKTWWKFNPEIRSTKSGKYNFVEGPYEIGVEGISVYFHDLVKGKPTSTLIGTMVIHQGVFKILSIFFNGEHYRIKQQSKNQFNTKEEAAAKIHSMFTHISSGNMDAIKNRIRELQKTVAELSSDISDEEYDSPKRKALQEKMKLIIEELRRLYIQMKKRDES